MKKPIVLSATLTVVVILATSGCQSTRVDSDVAHQRIEAILAEPPSTDVWPKRCLRTVDYDSVDVLDDRHVLFRGPHDRIWLNVLRSRCGGLSSNTTLLFNLRSTNICDLDTFTGVHAFFRFWQRETATCALGTFHPVTAEQVEMIERALRK